MNQINIGITDDHALFLQGMSSLFEAVENIRVVLKASNGLELLKQLENGPVPDVLLLDLNMPEMDGIAVMDALREKHPEIRVIILSMQRDEALVVHLIEKGAHGYLLKNSTLNEVVGAIEAVMTVGYSYDAFVIQAMRNGLVVKRKKPVSLSSETQFTPRELEVLLLLCQELTAAEIAERLFVSKRTVEGHKQILLQKTGARNTVGLILYALREGILDLSE